MMLDIFTIPTFLFNNLTKMKGSLLAYVMHECDKLDH